MSEKDWIKEKAEEIKALFEDGFQFEDIKKGAEIAVEAVNKARELAGDDPKKAATELLCMVIDETDTPWLPDDLTDPILKFVAPYAVDRVFQALEDVILDNGTEPG